MRIQLFLLLVLAQSMINANNLPAQQSDDVEMQQAPELPAFIVAAKQQADYGPMRHKSPRPNPDSDRLPYWNPNQRRPNPNPFRPARPKIPRLPRAHAITSTPLKSSL